MPVFDSSLKIIDPWSEQVQSLVDAERSGYINHSEMSGVLGDLGEENIKADVVENRVVGIRITCKIKINAKTSIHSVRP